MSTPQALKKLKKPQIVITVPHAICPANTLEHYYHPCDYFALSAALSLQKKIRDTGQFDPILFVPIITRRQCDLNRQICRDTEYRKSVSQYLQENKDNIKIVLDIHSFPDGDLGKPGDAIVLLDDSVIFFNDMAAFDTHNLSLLHDLSVHRVQSSLLGGKSNDIQVEAREDWQLPAILIEFNESLRSKTPKEDQLAFVTETLANWLATHFPFSN